MSPTLLFFYLLSVAGGGLVVGIAYLVWFFLLNIVNGLLTHESDQSS